MKRTLISIGWAMGPSRRKVPRKATERCERDFLTLVLRVNNSNEIRERTATIEPSKGHHDRPIRHTSSISLTLERSEGGLKGELYAGLRWIERRHNAV